MSTLDILLKDPSRSNELKVLSNRLRERAVDFSKEFKTSWVELGQALYSIHREKLFHAWGHEKFEDYTEKELGLKKPLSIKLLKTYYFLEQEEPHYLKEDFLQGKEAKKVPHYDALNVLRLAKRTSELTPGEYVQLKKNVFERGQDAAVVRKDLTALMKERKEVNPEEERDKRNKLTIRKLMQAIESFRKDAEAMKLVPQDVISQAAVLMEKLEAQV